MTRSAAFLLGNVALSSTAQASPEDNVTGCSGSGSGPNCAFVRDDVNSIHDLKDLLGPSLAWDFEQAQDMSEASQIVGSGRNASSWQKGFVLTPCTAATPESSGPRTLELALHKRSTQ